jgi:hypothetical protein
MARPAAGHPHDDLEVAGTMGHCSAMRYTMTRPHKLLERFEIANEAGEIAFEARIHGYGAVTMRDRAGREVASNSGLASGSGVEVRIGGKNVAKVFRVPHTGGCSCVPSIFGIPSAFGEFEATVQTTGWGDRWTLTRDGVCVATKEDQILKDDPVRGTGKYRIEITDGENAAFVLVTLFVVKYHRWCAAAQVAGVGCRARYMAGRSQVHRMTLPASTVLPRFPGGQ